MLMRREPFFLSVEDLDRLEKDSVIMLFTGRREKRGWRRVTKDSREARKTRPHVKLRHIAYPYPGRTSQMKKLDNEKLFFTKRRHFTNVIYSVANHHSFVLFASIAENVILIIPSCSQSSVWCLQPCCHIW